MRPIFRLSIFLAFAVHIPAVSAAPQTNDEAKKAVAAADRREDDLQSRLVDAAGIALNTEIVRSGYVHVESVLLPPETVVKIFGKEVAGSLAVVRIYVSNASRDASFVLKSLAIDYSSWPLSNCVQPTSPPFRTQNPFASPQTASTPATPPAGATTPVRAPLAIELQARDVDSYSYPCRVASMEVREVRQAVRLAQIEWWRNRTDRTLRGAGVLGGALTGVFRHGSVFPRIVSAYGVVPSVFEDIFRDPTDDQVNLLNDLAFRMNLLVPKESAVTVTAFFPMKRFLSSQLQELFVNEPALFFSPQQYLINGPDKKTGTDYEALFKKLLATYADTSLQGQVQCKARQVNNTTCGQCQIFANWTPVETNELNVVKNCALFELLQEITLNNIYLVGSGEFVADINSVAAQITGVTFDTTGIAAFGQSGTVTGSVTGQFLSGADIKLSNGDALGVKIVKVAQGSDDKTLKFTLTLSKAIPPGTKLGFIAFKKGTDREIDSNTFEASIDYAPDQAPKLDANQTIEAGKDQDLTGDNFYQLGTYKLEAFISIDGAKPPKTPLPIKTVDTTKKITVTVPKEVKAGKQYIEVTLNGKSSGAVEVTAK